MATIKNLVYSAGNLVQWEESDDTFTIEYLNGKPVSVTSKSGPWLEQSCELTYDGQGKFTGFTKEIKTTMLPQIIAMASGTVTATANLTGGSAIFNVGSDQIEVPRLGPYGDNKLVATDYYPYLAFCENSTYRFAKQDGADGVILRVALSDASTSNGVAVTSLYADDGATLITSGSIINVW